MNALGVAAAMSGSTYRVAKVAIPQRTPFEPLIAPLRDGSFWEAAEVSWMTEMGREAVGSYRYNYF